MQLNNLINKKTEIMECIQNKLADVIYHKFGGVVLEAKSFDNELSQKESDAIWDKIYDKNPDISPEDADKEYQRLSKELLKNNSIYPQTEDEREWAKQNDKDEREARKEENGGKDPEVELPKLPDENSLSKAVRDYLNRKKNGEKTWENEAIKDHPVRKVNVSDRFKTYLNDEEKKEEEGAKQAGESLEQAKKNRQNAADATETYNQQVNQLAQHLVNIGKAKNIDDAKKSLTDATKSQRDAYVKNMHKSANDLEDKASKASFSQYNYMDPKTLVTYNGIVDTTENRGGVDKRTGRYIPPNFAGYPDKGEDGATSDPHEQHYKKVVGAFNTKQSKNGSSHTVASIQDGVASGKFNRNNPPEDFLGSHRDWQRIFDTVSINIHNDNVKRDSRIASDIRDGTVNNQSRESTEKLLNALKEKAQQAERKLSKENFGKADNKSDGFAHYAPTEETPDKLSIKFDKKEKTEGENDNNDVKANFSELPWKSSESTEDIAKRVAQQQGTGATITREKGEPTRQGRPAKTNPTRVVNLPEEIIHNTKMMLSEMIRESFNLWDALPKEMQDDIINSSNASDKKAFVRTMRNIGSNASKKIKDYENSVQGTYDRDLSDAHQTELTRRGLETHDDRAETSSNGKNSDTFTLSVFRKPQKWRSTHYSADANGGSLSNYEGEQISGKKGGGQIPSNAKESGSKVNIGNYKLSVVSKKINAIRDKERKQKQNQKNEQIEYGTKIVENSDDTNIRAWVSGKNRVGLKVDTNRVSPEDMASDVGYGGISQSELSGDDRGDILDIYNKTLKASQNYKEPKPEKSSIIPKTLTINDEDKPEVKVKKRKTIDQIIKREEGKKNKLDSDKRVKTVLDNLTDNPSIHGKQKEEYAKRAYNKFPELFQQELIGLNAIDSQKKALEDASKKKVNWGKKEQPFVVYTDEDKVKPQSDSPNKFKGAKPSEHFTLPKKEIRYLDVKKLVDDFKRENPKTDFGQKIKKAMNK